MEIIGEYENGFIVKLSITEIANLTGYSSSYSSGFTKPKIGHKVDITTLFDRITSIEYLLNKGLSEAIDNLNNKCESYNLRITKLEP
jgi:hypothetical protein